MFRYLIVLLCITCFSYTAPQSSGITVSNNYFDSLRQDLELRPDCVVKFNASHTLAPCNRPIPPNVTAVEFVYDFEIFLCMGVYDSILRVCDIDIKLSSTLVHTLLTSERTVGPKDFCESLQNSIEILNGTYIKSEWLTVLKQNLHDADACHKACIDSKIGVNPLCSFIQEATVILNSRESTNDPEVVTANKPSLVPLKKKEMYENRSVGAPTQPVKTQKTDVTVANPNTTSGDQLAPQAASGSNDGEPHNSKPRAGNASSSSPPPPPPSPHTEPKELNNGILVTQLSPGNQPTPGMSENSSVVEPPFDPDADLETEIDVPGETFVRGKDTSEIKTAPAVNPSNEGDFPVGESYAKQPSYTDLDTKNDMPDETSVKGKDTSKIKSVPFIKQSNKETPGPQGNDVFVDNEDSHFFVYFVTMVVLCIIGYLVFHNKQKILALTLEGHSRRNARRRQNTTKYRKLDSNLEEAVTSSCKQSTTNIIY